jgi:hypothetical protein
VVLDHHLLNGHGHMTLITFQDGKPVMRDGKVGTEQECCCCDQCKVRLYTAYSVCVANPPDTSQEDWLCQIYANAFDWLKTALESYGWTVTISDIPFPELPPGCEEENVACAKRLVAECSMCGFDGLGDAEVFSLSEYEADNPLPEEPPLNGAPQPQQVFLGIGPLTMLGSWPCDASRGTFEVGFNPPYEYPTCNPLP